MTAARQRRAPKWDPLAPKWESLAPKWDLLAPKWDLLAPKGDLLAPKCAQRRHLEANKSHFGANKSHFGGQGASGRPLIRGIRQRPLGSDSTSMARKKRLIGTASRAPTGPRTQVQKISETMVSVVERPTASPT